jgi:PPOX class probable F420-dependent enzyme
LWRVDWNTLDDPNLRVVVPSGEHDPAHPAGMDTQPTTVAATRIHRFLEREPVVWLSTVRPDGGPHLVPIWFWWDGEAVLVFSKHGAQKVRNLRVQPSVMLALGDAEDDFDVGLLRGRAELLDQPTREVLPAEHLDKYAAKLAAIGVAPMSTRRRTQQVIRIVPDDLPWHGRTSPQSPAGGAPALHRRAAAFGLGDRWRAGRPCPGRRGGPSSNHVDRDRRWATGSASRWPAGCAD